MGIRVAINQATLMSCATEEFFEAAAKAGFGSVELRMDRLKESLGHLSLRELQKQKETLGLSVLALNALEGATFVPEDNLDILRLDCEMVGRVAEALEIPWVITPSAMWLDSDGPAPARAEANKRIADRTAFIAEILRPHGTRLALEPVGLPGFILKSLEQTQGIIDSIGNRAIGIAPDIHILACNDEGPESLSRVSSAFCVIHLNDTKDLPREKQHVVNTRTFPGDGIADSRAWVDAALSAGYTGYFSLELFDEELWAIPPSEAADLCMGKLITFLEPFGGISSPGSESN